MCVQVGNAELWKWERWGGDVGLGAVSGAANVPSWELAGAPSSAPYLEGAGLQTGLW